MPIRHIFKVAAAVLFMGVSSVSSAMADRDDLIIKNSASDVATTADKLVAAVEAAGATVFARVDHAEGARSVDAQLDPMVLVMFGNPKLGTPILQASPVTSLDLPVRVLIWEENGTTKVGYLDPDELEDRYDVDGADQAFDMMAGALKKLTDAAVK